MLLIISGSTTFLENSGMSEEPPIEIFCLLKIISLSIIMLDFEVFFIYDISNLLKVIIFSV